jgi:hypothetical protein
MAKKYTPTAPPGNGLIGRRCCTGGNAPARRTCRAHVLLLAAEGGTDEEIARALQLGESTVERTRRRFVERGVERAFTDRPPPGKPGRCRRLLLLHTY